MLRYLASIFAGYFLILLWVMTSHSIVWWIGGTDFAFQDGTRLETLPWIVISLLFWIIGGVIGGFVSALIAKHPTSLPSSVLAALVFAMSLYSAFAYLKTGPLELPAGVDPTSIDAAQFGIKPVWYPFVMAFLVAGGVLVGSWLVGDQSDEEAAVTPEG